MEIRKGYEQRLYVRNEYVIGKMGLWINSKETLFVRRRIVMDPSKTMMSDENTFGVRKAIIICRCTACNMVSPSVKCLGHTAQIPDRSDSRIKQLNTVLIVKDIRATMRATPATLYA